MARRWDLLEDFIIYEYCKKLECAYEDEQELSKMLESLKAEGFNSRTKAAVQTRARYYEYLYRGWNDPNIPRQVVQVYDAYYNKITNREIYQSIERYVNEYSGINPDDEEAKIPEGAQSDSAQITGGSGDWLFNSDQPVTTNLVATEPLEPSFKELLLEYIRRSGLSDAEVYKASYVSRDTFNHIINGRKGKKVKADNDKNKVNASPQTVMQLCIGLKLPYTEAVRLMTRAGYAFRPDQLHDRVIAACIRENIFNMVEVNMELYARRLPLIKRPNFEGVPPEQKKKKTEENKEASDQK